MTRLTTYALATTYTATTSEVTLGPDQAQLDWRITVGTNAMVESQLGFTATKLSAVRRFNAAVRLHPGKIVDLHRVCEGGRLAGKATRTSDGWLS